MGWFVRPWLAPSGDEVRLRHRNSTDAAATVGAITASASGLNEIARMHSVRHRPSENTSAETSCSLATLGLQSIGLTCSSEDCRFRTYRPMHWTATQHAGVAADARPE